MVLSLGPQQLQSPLQVALYGCDRRIQRGRQSLPASGLPGSGERARRVAAQAAWREVAPRREPTASFALPHGAMIFFHLNPQVHAAHPATPQGIRGTIHRHAAQPITTCCGDSIFAMWRSNSIKTPAQSLQRGHDHRSFARRAKTPSIVLVHDLFKIRLPVVGHGLASTFLSARECAGGCRRYAVGRKKFERVVLPERLRADSRTCNHYGQWFGIKPSALYFSVNPP